MATYFVSTTGVDVGNTTGSQVSPWATITKAFSVVTRGDTLKLRGGNYGTQGINNASHTIPTGTSWTDAPRIESFEGELATIRTAAFYAAYCKYVILTRIKIDGAYNGGVITGNGAHHIRWVDCEITRGNDAGGVHLTGEGGYHEFLRGSVHKNGLRSDYDHGFYIHSPGNLIDGVDVYENAASGIHLYIGSLPAGTNSNNIIRNCRVRKNRDIPGLQAIGAIVVGGGSNIMVYNNLVYGNLGANGIQVSYGGVNAAKIYHNTIYGNTGPYGVLVGSDALNTVLRNNAMYQSGAYRNDNATTIEDHNLGFRSVVNPLFVNAF